MRGEPHPALFLFQRFILGPFCLVCAGFGVWAAVNGHWPSATLLLTACAVGGILVYRLSLRQSQPPPSRAGGLQTEDSPDDAEPDDFQVLANVIVQANVLFCCLLLGLVWSEHLALMRSAILVVLFSILFPAAAVLFCAVGEEMLRRSHRHHSGIRREPPHFRGASRPH